MPEANAEPHHIRDARQHTSKSKLARCVAVASLLQIAFAPARAAAQLPPSPLPPSNTEDARTLPKGTVQFRALNAWTRIDAVYDAAADSAHRLHALGDAFNATQLGTRQFPGLIPAENALRTLTGDPNLTLNLGQTFGTVDTRIVTTPLSLLYGVTNRLTIGAMMPVVQTHSNVVVELNPRRLGANANINVGPNPARLGQPGNNLQLIQALAKADTDLARFIAACGTSGSCSQQALDQANRSRNLDTLYEKAVQVLYGTDSQASLFAPLGTAQTAVTSQLTALEQQINGLLGTSYSFPAPAGASDRAALQQLRQLATEPSGVAFDSLGSPDRIGIGDVEVAALFKLVDGFSDSTGGLRLRGTLRGVLRLGTGRPPSGRVPFDVGTGTGQTSADGGAVFDVRFGRKLMTTIAAQYTQYFTSADVARLPNSDYALFPLDVPVAGTWREGSAIQVDATPRVQLTDYLSFHGAYALRHQAASTYRAPDGGSPPLFAATTEQRAGFGFAYSTVNRYAAGRASVPVELFFTHLETLTASGGLTPKYNRDQIELRIYYRLRRGGR
jgi:hypothetical protein